MVLISRKDCSIKTEQEIQKFLNLVETDIKSIMMEQSGFPVTISIFYKSKDVKRVEASIDKQIVPYISESLDDLTMKLDEKLCVKLMDFLDELS